MLDLIDLLLLRRGIPADDRTLTFRRIDGNPTSKVLYFLPWNTPFAIARRAGFTPLDFLACYEMPSAIVGAEPSLCVQAMQALVADAERLLAEKALLGNDILIVGLSAGTYPRPILPIACTLVFARSPQPIARIWRFGRAPRRVSSGIGPRRRGSG